MELRSWMLRGTEEVRGRDLQWRSEWLLSEDRLCKTKDGENTWQTHKNADECMLFMLCWSQDDKQTRGRTTLDKRTGFTV